MRRKKFQATMTEYPWEDATGIEVAEGMMVVGDDSFGGFADFISYEGIDADVDLLTLGSDPDRNRDPLRTV